MKDLRYVVGLAVVASLLGGTGCGKIKEKIIEKVTEKAVEKAIEAKTGSDVDIDTSSGTVKIKDEKTGQVAEWGAQAKLPEGWPSDVPIYPGATILGSLRLNEGMTVNLETTDGVDKVSSFYQAKFSGFKKELEMASGETKVTSYSQEKRQISLTIAETDKSKDKKTGIHLMVATKK